ncbi:MAG: class I SAM-dependent methyltransferase [Myxococcaceae bacterium]|nr:class I SAM-dependent methyltransferase [Myxococcaceae bacterium]
MRGIEQIPAIYDAMCAVSEALGLRRWRQWLTGGATGRVLEVGCGTGRNLLLYPPGRFVVAVEPDAVALRAAKKRAGSIPLIRARAEALPFKDGVFDTVVSGLVFCTVPDPRAGLAEIRRVLGADGRLRMLEHVRSTRPWRARLQDFVQPVWTKIAGGCHPNRDTERTVESSGFRILEASRRAQGTLRRFEAVPVSTR